MAIRKSVDEAVVVEGDRESWLGRIADSMNSQGFKRVTRNDALGQVDGDYKKATVWGSLQVTAIPQGDQQTRLEMKATANVDNVFALAGSPGKKILERFKAGLSTAPVPSSIEKPQDPPPLPGDAVSLPAANWYPDPKGEARLRYWDGSAWTDATAP